MRYVFVSLVMCLALVSCATATPSKLRAITVCKDFMHATRFSDVIADDPSMANPKEVNRAVTIENNVYHVHWHGHATIANQGMTVYFDCSAITSDGKSYVVRIDSMYAVPEHK